MTETPDSLHVLFNEGPHGELRYVELEAPLGTALNSKGTFGSWSWYQNFRLLTITREELEKLFGTSKQMEDDRKAVDDGRADHIDWDMEALEEDLYEAMLTEAMIETRYPDDDDPVEVVVESYVDDVLPGLARHLARHQIARRQPVTPNPDEWRKAAEVVLERVKVGDEPALEFIAKVVKLAGGQPATPETVTEWLDGIRHDEEFEYTQSADCDGSNVKHWKRTPKRVITAGPWVPIEEEEGN